VALEEMTVFAAGYWLAESRSKGEAFRMDLESAGGVLQDLFDLGWQLLLLAALEWTLQFLSPSLPQINLVSLGLALAGAYGLSLWRRRSPGAAEPYFLALTVLAFAVQKEQFLTSGLAGLGGFARLLGATLVCEVVLLGLKNRLRWSPMPPAVQGAPIFILCTSMLALMVWCFR